MIALAFYLSAMLGLLTTSSSDGFDSAMRGSHHSEDLTPVRALAFTMHDPILIEGNAGFLGPNATTGITGGSGTASDPYIIGGWEINAGGISNPITIGNTTEHFRIQDCYVHDASNAGIQLWNVRNGALFNNNCSNNWYGIYLSYSSSDNVISNNSCSNNQLDGIELYHLCNNNTLSNNTCSNNLDGIHLESSSNDTLSSNVMINNGISIIGYLLSDCNTHDIGTSNTVNGRPIYYYKNQNGMTVPAGAGEIILANCTDIIIENQNLWDATVGIEIAFSSKIVIRNNSFLNNTYGILLWFSNGNTLSNNTITNSNVSSDDWWYGIGLRFSSDNAIINNYCSNCKYGIGLVSHSDNNTIINNNCSNNLYVGIELNHLCNNNTIRNNTCSSNLDGIHLKSSNNNTLVSNTCSYNLQHGAFLLLSSSNTFASNIFSNNTKYAMDLMPASSNNWIWNNTFINNNGAGDNYDGAHVQAYDDGTGNCWTSTNGYGNCWSDWTTPDVAPPYGMVDVPYEIAGSAGAKDYFPLTDMPSEPIPEFGMMPIVVPILLVAIVLTIETRRRKVQ